MAEGWQESAGAWIESVDRGDISREDLLDGVMLEQAGETKGKAVLDVGCGEGRFCRMLADRGATVFGIDPIETFIEAAKERHSAGHYALGSGTDLPFEDASFDIVVSYLTLIDILDYRTAIAEMARVLKPGCRLLVANISNFNSTSPYGWVKDGDGNRLHFKIDSYMEERPIWIEWKGIRIVNYHRPLSSYMDAFLTSGLILRAFLEPLPSEEIVKTKPEWKDYWRAPNFQVMVWEKPAS